MTRTAAAALLLAASTGCSSPSPPGPPSSAADAARELFLLPSVADERPVRLEEVLDLRAGEADDPDPSLRDALLALPATISIEVVGEKELPSGSTAVEVRAALA